jgi:hypothetical protein
LNVPLDADHRAHFYPAISALGNITAAGARKLWNRCKSEVPDALLANVIAVNGNPNGMLVTSVPNLKRILPYISAHSSAIRKNTSALTIAMANSYELALNEDVVGLAAVGRHFRENAPLAYRAAMAVVDPPALMAAPAPAPAAGSALAIDTRGTDSDVVSIKRPRYASYYDTDSDLDFEGEVRGRGYPRVACDADIVGTFQNCPESPPGRAAKSTPADATLAIASKIIEANPGNADIANKAMDLLLALIQPPTTPAPAPVAPALLALPAPPAPPSEEPPLPYPPLPPPEVLPPLPPTERARCERCNEKLGGGHVGRTLHDRCALPVYAGTNPRPCDCGSPSAVLAIPRPYTCNGCGGTITLHQRFYCRNTDCTHDRWTMHLRGEKIGRAPPCENCGTPQRERVATKFMRVERV